MLIDSKLLERKLAHLGFIPTLLVCITTTLVGLFLYLAEKESDTNKSLFFTSSLFNNININSSQNFYALSDNILSTTEYYAIALLNENKQVLLARGTGITPSENSANSTITSQKNHSEKVTFTAPISYTYTHTKNDANLSTTIDDFKSNGRINEVLYASGWITITRSSHSNNLWRHKAVIYLLLSFICAFFVIAFFIRRLKKLILDPLLPISKGFDQLIQEDFEHRITTSENSLFHPLEVKINQVSDILETSHNNLQLTIDQSLSELRESFETVEIQNIEIDLARKNALKANQATSEFLANTSHEIRTPINGIIGFTNLLRKTNITDKQSEYVDTIEESAKVLLLNINDIIDYSRLEIGKLNLDYKPINIRDIIKESQKYLLAHSNAANVRLNCNISDATPVRLLGDSMRLKQVYNNLLGSAIELSESNTISSFVDIEDRDDNKITLKISIVIQGQHKQNLRLNEASRVLSSPTPEHELLNSKHLMSLIIARGLVTRMQGHIGLTTKAEEAIFWFTAELGQPDRDRNVPALAQQTKTSVLVVDDNPSNRRLVCELFREMNIDVETAESGIKAIELYKENKYSMILMDIQMPGLNGFDTTREIRALEVDGKRTPIVALTAHAVEDEKSELLISGMDDFTSKPVGEIELRELLSRWTKHSAVNEKIPRNSSTPPPPQVQRPTPPIIAPKIEGPQPPVVISSCVDLAKGNRALAKDMLTMLLKTLHTDIQDIKGFWKDKDYENLHEIVHRIHGGACYCGVPRLLTSSAKTDKNLKDKRYGNLETEIDELIESCQELIAWQEEHDLALLFTT